MVSKALKCFQVGGSPGGHCGDDFFFYCYSFYKESEVLPWTPAGRSIPLFVYWVADGRTQHPHHTEPEVRMSLRKSRRAA